MKVGIIGFGIVGKATANTLSKSYKLVIYDKYQKLDDFRKLSSCDFIFIMVPTPFDYQNNRVDDSAIIESLNKLQENSFPNTVIIKSTVAPGYCKKYEGKYNLQIVFNPEFLRESTTPSHSYFEMRWRKAFKLSPQKYRPLPSLIASINMINLFPVT